MGLFFYTSRRENKLRVCEQRQQACIEYVVPMLMMMDIKVVRMMMTMIMTVITTMIMRERGNMGRIATRDGMPHR